MLHFICHIEPVRRTEHPQGTRKPEQKSTEHYPPPPSLLIQTWLFFMPICPASGVRLQAILVLRGSIFRRYMRG